MNNKPVSKTNSELLKAEENFLKTIYSDDFYGINNDLIVANRCIKMKVKGNPDNFKESLTNQLEKLPFPYISHETYIYDYSDLETHLIHQIKKFYSEYNLQIINGPIYVLLFQAPYLRYIDDQCKIHERSVQFNYYYKFNDLGYKIENKYNCNTPVDIKKTYIQMYILFPTYNKNGEFVYRNWENIKCNMSQLLKQFEHDKGCFIKCKDSNKACGCLNINNPYKSRCTGDNIYNDYYTVKIPYTVQVPYKEKVPYTVTVKYIVGYETKTRIETVKNTCDNSDDKKVKFYQHTSYKGYTHSYDIGSHPRTRETNEYSSAIVGKCVGVDVYSHSNFGGRRLATLQPGRSYYNLDTVGAHDDIDSIKVYYKDPGTSGKATRYQAPIYKYRTETRYKEIIKYRPEIKYRSETKYRELGFDSKLYNYGMLYVVNNDKLARITDGNLSNGFSIQIKPYYDGVLDNERCNIITKDPITIPNLI